MKRSAKRILSAALALILIFSLSVPAFAAVNEKGQKYSEFTYYYVMGDSIPTRVGPGMSDENSHFLTPSHLDPYYKSKHSLKIGSYPDLVASKLGITPDYGYDGTHVGWRTQEARVAINPDYDGDDYTANWEYDWAGDTLKSIQSNREDNIAALKKADLITINLGNNNVVGTATRTLYNELGINVNNIEKMGITEFVDIDAILAQAKAMPADKALVYLLNTAFDIFGDLNDFVKAALKDLGVAMKEFAESWDALIADIRDINPDATIVAISMYNAVGSAVVSNVDGLSPAVADALNAITDPAVEYFNNHMAIKSSMRNEYVFADITAVDLAGSQDGAHLGKAGHEYYAKKIIQAINSLGPCEHNSTELVGEKAATKITLGYSGDTVCTDCGKVLHEGHVTTYLDSQAIGGFVMPDFIKALFSFDFMQFIVRLFNIFGFGK